MEKKVFIDQMGRRLHLASTPKRIICLVPSITELLYDLGLVKYIVGRTKFCVHPKEALKVVPKIGGTKNVNLDRIAALQPDLIIANKEENQREQIEQLSRKFPVWISDIRIFQDAMEMIEQIGIIVNRPIQANKIIRDSNNLLQKISSKKKLKAAYLIWQKPYMTIGHDTYIHDMLSHAGFENVFGEQTRYPTFTLAELKDRQPNIILLSSEPFPFTEKHIEEIQGYFDNTIIRLVDGEKFSWYGTRFLKTFIP